VESLLEHLLNLLDHPAQAHSAGERLHRRAIEQFEWQRAGRQIVDAYRFLVERGRSSPAASELSIPSE
jgi:glycosyltransferase involved in cell wall biosynthesis